MYLQVSTHAGTLPDTGQNQSFTDIVGEDHDYRRPRSYTINNDGTVLDNVTSLMWQREDDSQTRLYAYATSYCYDLSLAGFTDWRPPSFKELQTLVNYGKYDPAIDTEAFPGTKSADYWNITQYAARSRMTINFKDGDAGSTQTDPTTYPHYIRCVRNSK